MQKKHYYELEVFQNIRELLHGFSTNYYGGMSDADFKHNTLKNFTEDMGIRESQVIRMVQVHGNKVTSVSKKNSGEAMSDTDAIITKDKNVFLCVRTADCLPVIIYDPIAKVVAAAHAGWRGAYNNIVAEVIAHMESSGSMAKNILVGVGPAIHACCYAIDTKRKELFLERYKEWEEFIFKERNGKVYLNLPALVRLQLIKVGVTKKHIAMSDICTHDSADFFSYRKETDKAKSQRFAGIIGMI